MTQKSFGSSNFFLITTIVLCLVVAGLLWSKFQETQVIIDENAATAESSVIVQSNAVPQSQVALSKTMRELWEDHMYWTLITVDAFFNDPVGLEAKLDRLLQNQQDIGDAMGLFYGEAAGQVLADLLKEHITDAVPVLEAARDNQEEALEEAVEERYENAREIGKFLAAANPNWSAEETKGALESHITHTIAYSVDILEENYTSSFGGFQEALDHMLMLADILTDGIVKQFPEKF